MLFNAAVFMIIMQGSEVISRVYLTCMQTDFLKEELQEVSMDNFYQVMVKSIRTMLVISLILYID